MATVGPKGKLKGTVNVCLSWDDEEGMKHTHVLSNVCYITDSPFNVFSVTEFGKATNSSDQGELTEGTSIQTFARHSVFKWEDGKHQRTFVHLPNSLPMLAFNNGYKAFNAFYYAVQDTDINKLRCALTSSEDKANEEA